MYGLRPRLQLDHIRDCMSNQKQGYLFMLDPGNNLERAYPELSFRACLDPVDGLMVGDGYSSKKGRSLFFNSSNDPERPWTVEVLTKALK